MKKKGCYSSGEFARKANVTLRTIRYYDAKGLLTPSFRSPSGARFYTNADLAKLQQILLFKYLGLSLDDIKELTVASGDQHFLLESLNMQKKLIQERIEEMKTVETTINKTIDAISYDAKVDYNNLLDLIQATTMEQSLKTQYQNAANISARISLHRNYSLNKQGWFPWLYEQCGIHAGMNILEIGCGNGELWLENMDKLPENISITLSDKSEGMIRDLQRTIKDNRFTFKVADAQAIPYEKECFDLVIANHVLFYCEDVKKAVSECARVLKKDGTFISSTYGSHHMKEITDLVQTFNPEIVLSRNKLYERFGLDNGEELLKTSFQTIECRRYEDAIEISEADPLISYILSCHGNQNHILLNRYKEFHDFVEAQTKNTFHITKEAGVFLAKK